MSFLVAEIWAILVLWRLCWMLLAIFSLLPLELSLPKLPLPRLAIKSPHDVKKMYEKSAAKLGASNTEDSQLPRYDMRKFSQP